MSGSRQERWYLAHGNIGSAFGEWVSHPLLSDSQVHPLNQGCLGFWEVEFWFGVVGQAVIFLFYRHQNTSWMWLCWLEIFLYWRNLVFVQKKKPKKQKTNKQTKKTQQNPKTCTWSSWDKVKLPIIFDIFIFFLNGLCRLVWNGNVKREVQI